MKTGTDEQASRTVKQMQEQLELFLNELGADVEVFRLLVQALFAAVLVEHPRKAQHFAMIRDGVLQAIARNPPPVDDPQGIGKRQQLTLMRAEAALLEIQRGLGIPTGGRGPSTSS